MLAALARRLNRAAGRTSLPALYFFTDPKRTPDPLRIAARLPRGAAVVYRHFGAADRLAVARELAKLCRARGLVLLIGADPELARAVGADGVHWPERMVGRWPAGRRSSQGIETAATHGARGIIRAAQAGMDAVVLAPVFPSRSGSGGQPLGPLRAGLLARTAPLPVIALGGVTTRTAKRLLGLGFSGIAAVDGLSED